MFIIKSSDPSQFAIVVSFGFGSVVGLCGKVSMCSTAEPQKDSEVVIIQSWVCQSGEWLREHAILV